MKNKLTVNIIEYPKNYKKILYLAGRNCYGLEEIEKNITDKHLIDFINKIILNNHDSVLEHCNVSIYLKNVTRSFMAQITRHRLVSFSIKSQHFINHSDFKFKELTNNNLFNAQINNLLDDLNTMYKHLIRNNIPHYIARDILPNACLTNIFMTTNIREWRHIIKLRITNNNTPETQEITKQILINLYLIMPELFSDLRDKYLEDRPDLKGGN